MSRSTFRLATGVLLIAVWGLLPAHAQNAKTAKAPQPRGQYPYLNAPLYPAPVPQVPAKMGGAVYTNQAFAPHEMLYAHKYRALYPPYYFKVDGGWWWTPFGMESHDRWKLQGTCVRVKYHSQCGPLSKITSPSHAPNYVGLTFHYLQSVLVQTGELFR